jgi:hypothetical protein
MSLIKLLKKNLRNLRDLREILIQNEIQSNT